LSRITDRHLDAVLDFHREARIGIGEAVLCEHKGADQIADILLRFREGETPCLLTRLPTGRFADLPLNLREAVDYEPVSRTGFFPRAHPRRHGVGAAVVSAGSSDAPVTLEAVRTLEFHGVDCTLFQDVGVTGLWRLLDRIEAIQAFPVVIAVAGMEGALFSALGGLVAAPVIAVPTSVGYGVANGGRLSLDSALGSCAPGILTVNIDNGYGAACAALRILNAAKQVNIAGKS
jgi:hypothetical protein